MKRYLLAACSIAALSGSPLLAADATPIETFKLANGLEVVVVSNHRTPAVSHMLWYRVGAADDPPGKSGLAHFHEHMMYAGTATYGNGVYADMINRAGGKQNALTTSDATAYYITISKDELPLAMRLEADRMSPLVPSNESTATEKEVIIEERRARIDNNPAALLSEQMDAALFRNHPYQLPIIGWAHEMQELSKSDVLRFHQTWYKPNNAVLVLSGDITAKEARPLVEQYYGGIPSGSVPSRKWESEPPQNAERKLVMRHPNVNQTVWSQMYATSSLGYGDKDNALPLIVLSQLLGGGKTSQLYRELVADEKLVSDINVSYDAFTRGPSRFEITATPEPGVKMEEVEKAVQEQLQKAMSEGFAKEDIERAKTLLKAEAVYARDGLDSMARVMGWIRMAGLSTDYFSRWPEMIDAVTPEQIAKAAKDTIKPEQSVTGWLLPQEKKEKK